MTRRSPFGVCTTGQTPPVTAARFAPVARVSAWRAVATPGRPSDGDTLNHGSLKEYMSTDLAAEQQLAIIERTRQLLLERAERSGRAAVSVSPTIGPAAVAATGAAVVSPGDGISRVSGIGAAMLSEA
jgi:hypothetical protein